MSPHRRLSLVSNRQNSSIQDAFIGLAFQISPPTDDPTKPRDLEYTVVLHDGTGVVESETFHFDYHQQKDGDEAGKTAEAKRFAQQGLALVRSVQTQKGMNVRLISIAEPVPIELKNRTGVEFFATIWLHVDCIPFIVTPSTSIFTKLPAPSTQANASSAVAMALKHLHPASHSATIADTAPSDHAVLVDCGGEVRLCSLTQYEESTSPQLWKRFLALSTLLRKNKTKIAFFSATPQGGGVALMRHALIRLWKMVGLEVKWYVPEGHPTVFDITKRKIHNVLQGVAPQGVEMNDEDHRWFELWTDQNYESFWSNGAIDADMIIIDDPQLTALIPLIKKKRPDAKIMFRSHIQIQSDLTDDPSTAQARTWDYLFNFIKDVDLFIAHPVKFFVPKNVKEKLPVLYMAPATDPLDGLNKPYGHASVRYYREHFNHLSREQCGVTIDWDRGYVCQIARFDPSKGIEDLLAAYLEFRQKLDALDRPPIDGGPQLIIMGHGSVDDPDGTVIYEKLHDMLATKEYDLVKGDVAIVRAPPSDSILGCILQGSWVATQLSTREGFEVKVTEAINKRVPIIASDAGGIPLQVKHGVNGWVTPVSSPSEVAKLLFDIYQGKIKVHRDLSRERELDGKSDPNSIAERFVSDYDMPMIKVHADDAATSEDFWTVGNATRWMLLTARLLGLKVDNDGDVEMNAEDQGLLSGMDIGKPLLGKGEEGGNVWQMVMGDDMVKGEGEIRVDGH
ncbi:hypothetical protein BCR39DRAFT_544106 [Naematelia encephala]|uniref:Uncharacterized protein n=1 Tax=Naematelia encephala TaxID=71784 RepID=A0A1Y2ASA9_9TREE|nr:hypothetical protein BCR39DRAFT_544106 [Naematelia encephala]